MNVHKTAMGPVLAVSLLGCGMLAACANNDGTGSTTGTSVQPTAGKGGSTSAAGSTAGSSAGGSTADLPGSAGSTAPMPVACGPKMCQPSTIMIPSLPTPMPCCASSTEGTCGWLDRSGTCMPPPPVDSDCPSSARGQKGCCVAATNRCGVDASLFGAGCYDLNSSPMFADPVNNPPQSCDGTLIEEGDGGMSDLDMSDGGVAGTSGGAGGARAGAGASGMGGAGGATAGSGGSQAGAGGAGGASAAGASGEAGAGGRGRFGRAGSFAPPTGGRFAPRAGRFAPPFGGRAAP